MRIKRKKKISLLTWLTISIVMLLLIASTIYYNYERKINGFDNDIEKITLSRDSNLKTGPSEQYPTLVNLTSGQEVEKQSTLGEWIEIKTKNNEVGWVAGWNIVGTNIKSPEDRFKEKLSKFKVLINPIFNENYEDYTFKYAEKIKKELANEKIEVSISREENYIIDKNILKTHANDYKSDVIINLIPINNSKSIGPEIYYSNYSSQILGRYIEKTISNNYITKVRSFEKNESLSSPILENIPEVTLTIGNIGNKVDEDLIKDSIFSQNYAYSVKKGLQNYFYYLLTLEEQDNNRREQLLNMPQKGLNIPFYYTRQVEFKDISYGTDNNKKISDNGDIIVALAMLANYFEPNSKITVSNIVDWAGNNYYNPKQGTSELIIPAFAKKYDYKIDIITEDYLKNINLALKNNKPILVKFMNGTFDNKQSYKIIRGEEDGKYYINDPNDDDSKLNNYTGFSSKDIEKNIIKAWVLSK